MVRGGASLQYGAQFGGMINYVTKSADTTKRISFETQQSVGSYGLFNSYNAIGGKLGKFKYYAYASYRRSDGYRENSNYKYQAYHANLEYDFSPQLNIKLAYNKMYYVNHLNGGLTDQQFKENPRQSTRKRNYYSPDIHVPSLTINYKLSKQTQINFISSAVLGERNSVQFIALSTVNDTINTTINAFNPRQVDRDYYNSYSNELRIVHNYQIAKMSNTLIAGIRYINNNLIRKQLGKGTSNSDYDLSLTSIDYGRDLKYKTGNVSLFVENLFKITDKLTFTAGVRVEDGETNTSGTIKNYDANKLPVQIKHQFALFGFSGEYAINENVKFLANWSQAYRPVIFADLIPSTTLNRVDPNIRDAFGHNSEISLRGNLKDVFQYDLTAFNVLYKHRIGDVFMTNNGQSFFYKTNTGTSRSYGLEFYGEISPFKSLGSYTKNWNVSIHTATSYLHAQYLNSAKPKNGENISVSGNQVEAAPNWMSRNGLQLRNKGFSTTIQYSFVGKSFADAFNTVTPNASGTTGIIPSYQLVDWNFTYRFQSGFNIKLLQNNILNKQYFTQRPSFFPGPGGLYPSDGRSFIISIGAKF